jgi:hypothetical protein
MSTETDKRAAKNLDAYIRFRARKEGVEYALSPEFFREALARGCVEFFGVAVGNNGELIRDAQFPRFFEEWRKIKQLN